MAAPRREARERALTLLYESDIKGTTPSEVLADLSVAPDDFTIDLVRAVGVNIVRIDELVAAASVGWELDRMPVVDRTILRLAVSELITDSDIPVAVVIDEAVELAKRFSTEESGSFVNGVLSTVAREVRPTV